MQGAKMRAEVRRVRPRIDDSLSLENLRVVQARDGSGEQPAGKARPAQVVSRSNVQSCSDFKPCVSSSSSRLHATQIKKGIDTFHGGLQLSSQQR